MDLPDVLDAIQVHCLAAGNALASPIKDVAVGWPVPRGRCIRIFWGGETKPARMGEHPRSQVGEMVSERVVIRAFWPLSDYGETKARTLIGEMWDLKHEIRTRLLGDSQLGGLTTDFEMGYAGADDVVIGGAAFTFIDIECITDYHDYPIAP